MTYIFRRIRVREEVERSAESLTSLTTPTELTHDWTAQHPRKPRQLDRCAQKIGTHFGQKGLPKNSANDFGHSPPGGP